MTVTASGSFQQHDELVWFERVRSTLRLEHQHYRLIKDDLRDLQAGNSARSNSDEISDYDVFGLLRHEERVHPSILVHDARRLLHEPHARPPLVLAQEQTAEFSESVGCILEGSDDRLALRNGESEDLRLAVACDLDLLGDVVEACESEKCRQLENASVGDGEAGEHHRVERTYVRLQLEDPVAEERSRPSRVGLRPPIPLSPEEEIRDRPGFRIPHRREVWDT